MEVKNLDQEAFEDRLKAASIEDIERLSKRPDLVHFVGMLMPPRPGAVLFTTRLEYEFYPPGSPSNDDFQLMIIRWMDMLWFVASIPKEGFDNAKKVAKECGLRIADGIPVCVSGEGNAAFPFNSPTTFNLENLAGHPVYGGNGAAIEAMLAKEEEQVQAIIQGHIKKLEQQETAAHN